MYSCPVPQVAVSQTVTMMKPVILTNSLERYLDPILSRMTIQETRTNQKLYIVLFVPENTRKRNVQIKIIIKIIT